MEQGISQLVHTLKLLPNTEIAKQLILPLLHILKWPVLKCIQILLAGAIFSTSVTIAPFLKPFWQYLFLKLPFSQNVVLVHNFVKKQR